MRKTALNLFITLSLALPMGACMTKPKTAPAAVDTNQVVSKKREPLKVFGSKKKTGENASIGVNSYLWRATLDTLNFFPILSADPFGGTFITDWHSNAGVAGERFKVQVFILDTRLRADGISVQVFRQTNNNGVWTDASVDPDTALQIENAILTRARQLRISNIESEK